MAKILWPSGYQKLEYIIFLSWNYPHVFGLFFLKDSQLLKKKDFLNTVTTSGLLEMQKAR